MNELAVTHSGCRGASAAVSSLPEGERERGREGERERGGDFSPRDAQEAKPGSDNTLKKQMAIDCY